MKEIRLLKKEDVEYVVVHCSDTPDSKNLTGIDIHKMHLGFGWEGIGYHKIIQRNGKIENGRPLYWVGAHAYGYNEKSISICLIGRENFSDKQLVSLKKFLDWTLIEYPKSKIVGHYQITKSSKTCPNFDVNKWYNNYHRSS